LESYIVLLYTNIISSCSLAKIYIMKKWILIFSICYFNILVVNAQTYTLWSRGNPTDTVTATTPCTLLMGGATEDDQAMKKFLQYANHGDIVVIRTSGSDGYNNYLYSDLGIQVHSVQTLLITTVAAANDSFVVQTVRNVEALWIAGGDQWTYVNNWKGHSIKFSDQSYNQCSSCANRWYKCGNGYHG
jgi:cyanophycinase-like exopeptidase